MRKIILVIAMVAIGVNMQAQSVITETSEGNVGIGTTNPKEKLDLRGNLYINAGVNDNYIFWEGHNMTMGTKPDNYYHNVFSLKPGGSSQGKLYSRLQMFSANSKSHHEKRVLINSGGNSYFNGGNVGIGISSPFTNLQVHGNGVDSRIALTNNASGTNAGDGFVLINESDNEIHFLNRENGALKFSTYATERMRVSENGNVGIGTTKPTSKLDISQ